MVLRANCREFLTLYLRPPVIYGQRDCQAIPGALVVLQDKKTHIKLGDSKNIHDSIYVGSAASAHINATKALSKIDDPDLKADGEAFFITDDAPVPFWDFQRKIWAAAGEKTPLTDVYVIPAWVGTAMAGIVEFSFLIFTLGQKLPPKEIRTDVLRYAITNRTFCIDKAKERLGYKPLFDTNEYITRGFE